MQSLNNLYIINCSHSLLYSVLLHVLFDAPVRSWSGEANTVDSSVSVGSKRHRDDWDREYDAGHVKKVRRHTTGESFSNTRNPFQDYQFKKHFKRVSKTMKYVPHNS